MEDAILDAQRTNEKKMNAIVNRLGEHTPDRKMIVDYTEEYLRLADRMQDSSLRGMISVKPSQLGLTIEPALFKQNLQRILDKASQSKRPVWVDMESSAYTEDTISAYQEFLQSYRDIGLCLQSNLKRTRADLEKLLGQDGRVRLVKGAYPESAEIALKRKDEIDQNFGSLLEVLFQQGSGFVVATHDDKLIDKAKTLSQEHRDVDFEFEFLKGIRDDIKGTLVEQGYRVGDYIPYGPEWYNYSKRRLRERKRNILLLLRSMTG